MFKPVLESSKLVNHNIQSMLTSRSNFLAAPVFSATHAMPSRIVSASALPCKLIGCPIVFVRSALFFLAFGNVLVVQTLFKMRETHFVKDKMSFGDKKI